MVTTRCGSLTVCLALGAALFGCTEPHLERRGDDLVPKQAAPGSPEVYVHASPETAALAVRLATALAQAGALAHLGAMPLPTGLQHIYVISLGTAANAEVASVSGRVALAPTALALDVGSTQPLLLIRGSDATPVEPSARPLWELKFDGLRPGASLSRDEEHSLFEAVVLWIRSRAVDE